MIRSSWDYSFTMDTRWGSTILGGTVISVISWAARYVITARNFGYLAGTIRILMGASELRSRNSQNHVSVGWICETYCRWCSELVQIF